MHETNACRRSAYLRPGKTLLPQTGAYVVDQSDCFAGTQRSGAPGLFYRRYRRHWATQVRRASAGRTAANSQRPGRHGFGLFLGDGRSSHPKGHFTSIAEHAGLAYETFIGQSAGSLPFFGVTKAEGKQNLSCLTARQAFRHIEIGLANAKGELRWFLLSGDPVWTPAGEFKGYRGVAQDISERRQVELRLLQKGVAFNSAQEGIVITDKLGCVIDANPAFERISEYSLQEIRGQNMRFMQSGRMDRSFYQNMWQSILTTGYWQGEIWNRRRAARYFWNG